VPHRRAEAELDFHTVALPGGSLFASVYDRVFMQLSDRGGASNLVGDRWAELCAAALAGDGVAGEEVRTGPGGILASTTVRLDDIPAIARTASANKLQNPDFLMLGSEGDGKVIWSADAKFSVDTARSKQVSGDVVDALLHLGETVRKLLPPLPEDFSIRNGVFLCPDYVLTHRLLRERRGPRRATVRDDEVRFVPVTATGFTGPLGQVGLRAFFAALDGLPFDPSQSLMVALYYFRLARAAVGCWQDQTAPLLAYHDTPVIDESAVEAQARDLATIRTTAWGLVQRWNDLAENVRRQREAVNHVTSVPVNGRLLRAEIEAAAARAKVVPPSGTRVRRAIGSWYRGRLRDEFGPIMPPVADFGATLDALGRFGRSLQPELASVTAKVIDDLVAEAKPLP